MKFTCKVQLQKMREFLHLKKTWIASMKSCHLACMKHGNRRIWPWIFSSLSKISVLHGCFEDYTLRHQVQRWATKQIITVQSKTLFWYPQHLVIEHETWVARKQNSHTSNCHMTIFYYNMFSVLMLRGKNVNKMKV